MARFFVGQRVRIVSCSNPVMKIHVGKEGRIQSRCSAFEGNWDVDCALTADYGAPCSWSERDLEPILPDGHRAGNFTNIHDLLESLTKEVA